MHLHVSDLDAAYRFYRDQLGLIPNAFARGIGFADLGAGGRLPHRVGLNVWQRPGATQRPPGVAGMERFTLRYVSKTRLGYALDKVEPSEQQDGSYLVHDPAGNELVLTT